jgi:hypothetical protein
VVAFRHPEHSTPVAINVSLLFIATKDTAAYNLIIDGDEN